MFDDTLFLIPARGGSKGIPNKNTKPLCGKPLIHYSVEYARLFTKDENICLSTDDEKIRNCAKEIGLEVPFVRPEIYATDTASSFEVMKHALDFYQSKNYQKLILLQPTSPFREKHHLEEAMLCFDEKTDVVVSVYEVKNNPYFNLFEENQNEYLQISKGDGKIMRRQDCPPVYAFNGSIYIFNIKSLQTSQSFKDLAHIRKYVMPEKYSIDLDTPADWAYADYFLRKITE
jgi:N-acylneuraminate cytidylyltransferase